mmetsp:Transcript_95507/g.175016  ORF Transcript_95507/g.175016 Transcript_95507/m.175016 type:complete len:237 (-) Transcript_95507:522-1232(-)
MVQRCSRRGRVVLQREGLECAEQLRKLLQREQPHELLIVVQPVIHDLDAGTACSDTILELGRALEKCENGDEAAVREIRHLHKDQQSACDSFGVGGKQSRRQFGQVLQQRKECCNQIRIANKPDAESNSVDDQSLNELLLSGTTASDHELQQTLKMGAHQWPDLRHSTLPLAEWHACHVREQLQSKNRIRNLVPLTSEQLCGGSTTARRRLGVSTRGCIWRSFATVLACGRPCWRS